jgi:hypothetical protein
MIYQDEHNGNRIRSTIEHWYGGVPTGSSRFEDLPPDSWFTNPNGYTGGTLEELNQYWHEYGLYTAYTSNCRLCHVVEEPSRLPFTRGSSFESLVKPFICGGRNFPPVNPRDTVDATRLAAGEIMPSAEVTLHRILEKNRSHGSLIWSDQDHICGWR